MSDFIKLIAILFVFAACKNSTDPKPVLADCPPGQLPCAEDSTMCCEIICPEHMHIGGQDSTSCVWNSTEHLQILDIDTLGIYGSYLEAVEIISEDDIWAAGYIITDSLEYNAAHWNGSDWELIEIAPWGYVQPIISMCYFGENEIWFGNQSQPVFYDGSTAYAYTSTVHGYPGGFNIMVMWGNSAEDIFFAGDFGKIVHFNGSVFTSIQSGVDVHFRDVATTENGEHVVLIGWIDGGGSAALHYHDQSWEIAYESDGYYPSEGDYGRVHSVAIHGDTAYVPVVSGIYKYNLLDQSVLLDTNILDDFQYHIFWDIEVQLPSDITYFGAAFKYAHFNGETYQFNPQIYYQFSQVSMGKADFEDDLGIMVGFCCGYGHAITVWLGR